MGNSNGSLADYWDVITSTPGLQGGFIWEWKDHGLLARLPNGKRGFAYGGQFGDEPNDGNFVADGLMSADLRAASGDAGGRVGAPARRGGARRRDARRSATVAASPTSPICAPRGNCSWRVSIVDVGELDVGEVAAVEHRSARPAVPHPRRCRRPPHHPLVAAPRHRLGPARPTSSPGTNSPSRSATVTAHNPPPRTRPAPKLRRSASAHRRSLRAGWSGRSCRCSGRRSTTTG